MQPNDKWEVRPSRPKTLAEIREEWDQMASIRERQQAGGEDLSFLHIIAPAVFQLLEDCDLSRVVDLGCGVGTLTEKIASKASKIVGVDVSSASIEIARSRHDRAANVEFFSDGVEEFAQKWAEPKFTSAVAAMSLMDSPNLVQFLEATASLLVDEGSFVAVVTHPWFWPRYWGYENAEWFEYRRELALEGQFRTSSEVTDQITTHFHRPLASYMRALKQTGFTVDLIEEPFPSASVEHLFSEEWDFPRFLSLRARKLR